MTDIAYAATGLSAAWLLSHFAGFRRVTFYIKQAPPPSLLEKLGFAKGRPARTSGWPCCATRESSLAKRLV